MRNSNDNSLSERFFDALANSGFVRPGAFIGLESTDITLCCNALAGGYTNTLLTIAFEEPKDSKPHPKRAHVSTDLSERSQGAIAFALNAVKTQHRLKQESMRVAFDTPLTVCDRFSDLIELIVDQCLVLDCVAVYANAYDADSDNVEYERFDIADCLGEHGVLGAERERLTSVFNEEASGCIDHVIAAYSLPYNLKILSDTGMIDTTLGENRNSLYGFTYFGRWFHGGEIIAALRACGFTDQQIACIICHDDELRPGIHEPGLALGLCNSIESSIFDPADELAWAEYLASEGGPLSDFL